MSDEQQNHSSNLKAAQASSLKNSAKNLKKSVKAVANVVSLMTYINPFMDWLFGIALIFAIIKDIMDIIDTALVPVGGVGAALIFITTFVCSMIIGFVMILTGSSSKKKAAKEQAKGLLKNSKWLVKLLLLLGVSLVEMIPAIDLLPTESIAVILIVIMTLKERRATAEAEKEEMTEQPRKTEQNPQFTTRTEQQLA
jgi:hydrogenase-4 membrane subunit HyfE